MYAHTKAALADQDGRLGPLQLLTAGAIAGHHELYDALILCHLLKIRRKFLIQDMYWFKLWFATVIQFGIDIWIFSHLQVSRPLHSSPLPMSSKHDCRWLPVLVRRLILEWSTALERSWRRKASGHCGREPEVHTWTCSLTSLLLYLNIRSQSSRGLLFSSCVQVFSPVWCDPGDLWAPTAMVLRRLWRTVSVKRDFTTWKQRLWSNIT